MLHTVAASTRRALAGTAAATGVLTVGIVALVAAAPSLPLDATVADWFSRTKVTWLLQTAAAVRFLASQAPFVLTFAVGAVLWWRGRRPAALLLMGSVNATDAANFPSSSIVACVAFWGLVSALLILNGGWGRRERALLAMSAVLIFLIGPSRLYVGDHWLTDVVGGYLLAASMSSLSLWMYLRHRSAPPQRGGDGGSHAVGSSPVAR